MKFNTPTAPTIYSATFRNLRPGFYKLNITIPGLFTVHLYLDHGKWRARYDRGGRISGRGSLTVSDAQQVVGLMFEEQVEPWSILQPAEVQP